MINPPPPPPKRQRQRQHHTPNVSAPIWTLCKVASGNVLAQYAGKRLLTSSFLYIVKTCHWQDYVLSKTSFITDSTGPHAQCPDSHLTVLKVPNWPAYRVRVGTFQRPSVHAKCPRSSVLHWTYSRPPPLVKVPTLTVTTNTQIEFKLHTYICSQTS